MNRPRPGNFCPAGDQGRQERREEKHYTVTLNNGKYLSFLDEGYLYFDRAAHPTSWKTGVVFDMETGRRITNWRELVKPGDEKAFTLQKSPTSDLERQRLVDILQRPDEDPKNFYLDKKGNIHFISVTKWHHTRRALSLY